jgi:hypothetical protein
MSTKNRSHGKIDKLPNEIKKAVENKLLEGYTYQNISDHLKTLGHDIHFSSVHRYGKHFLKQFESVRMAKEFAQLLSEDNAERPTTELHEANNAIISQLLMEMLVDESKPLNEKLNAYRAIAELQTAQVKNERLKITSRKEAGTVRAAMNMLKERVFKEIQDNHPDIVEALIRIADEITAESAVN